MRLSQRDDDLILDNAKAVGAHVTLGPERLTLVQAVGLYVTFSATAVGGQVTISTAPTPGHVGPWDPIKVVDWIAKGRTHYVPLTGAYLAITIAVTKPIIEGVVTVHAVGA